MNGNQELFVIQITHEKTRRFAFLVCELNSSLYMQPSTMNGLDCNAMARNVLLLRNDSENITRARNPNIVHDVEDDDVVVDDNNERKRGRECVHQRTSSTYVNG